MSNFDSNFVSLTANHRWLESLQFPSRNSLRWVIGRDGALTARVIEADIERWYGDCSLPERASAAMLKSTRLVNPVTCFLAPFHGVAVRCLLENLSPEQAVIAVVPDEFDLAVMLGCVDFFDDISAHRVWFVSSDGWETQLAELLASQPGLAVPSQFLRLNNADPTQIDDLIQRCQTIFSKAVGERAAGIVALQSEVIVRERRRICAMTPTRFRLWEDEGHALAESLPADAIRLNTSDPADASPLALARSAADAGILLTPNIARSDMPGVVPSDVPWVTWVTGERIPPVGSCGQRDHLIIADADVLKTARSVGWPVERIRLGYWPIVSPDEPSIDRPLAVVCDTEALTTPADLEGFSSHRMVWETLRSEIISDPFPVNRVGARRYLNQRLERFSVSAEGFPIERFVSQLVVPAYTQSLVTKLLASGVALRLFGEGWGEIDAFASYAAGPIRSRAAIRAAVGPRGVFHVWPTCHHPAISSLAVPILRPAQSVSGRVVLNELPVFRTPPATLLAEAIAATVAAISS